MSNSILKKLSESEKKGWGTILRDAVMDNENVQNEVVCDICSYAADTDYGRRYGFSYIKSTEEFRQKVPLTEFCDYSEYIERLKKGEENVLFPEKALSFIATSGTTGNIKYIPESKSGDSIKQLISSMRFIEMAKLAPAAMAPELKIFAITNIYGIMYTEGGIPVGTASGQAAARIKKSRDRMVVPDLLLKTLVEPDQLDYMMALYGAAERNVGIVVCNNMAHLRNLLSLINAKIGMLAEDIRCGTISYAVDEDKKDVLIPTLKADPARAEELLAIYEKNGKLTAEDIWKNVKLYGCWLSSSVGRIAEEVRPLLHKDAVFMHWGYGASEGKFDIPVEKNSPRGLPAVFGYFFEFLKPGEEKTILLHETKSDELYELILTSYSGFYRYNIHDLVKVTRSDDGLYYIEFVCKASDSLILNGKKIYACQLSDIFTGFEKNNNVFFRLFQGKNEDEKLRLLVEPDNDVNISQLSSYISEKLADLGIELAGIDIMPEGYRDKCLVQKLESGKSVNQTKLQIFIK